jgi:glycosyltransferase involved in cell wall biosynthesis
MKKQITICLFGSYNHNLPSSTLISSGLKQYVSDDYTVITVHEPVPVDFIQRPEHLSVVNILKRFVNRVKAFTRLVLRTPEALKADVFVILTPGQTDVLLTLVYKFLFGKKIIYIPQISLFDVMRTILVDRPIMRPLIKLSYLIERKLFNLCDVVLFNTKQEVAYHKDLLNLPSLKTGVVPLGADDSLFYPNEKTKKSSIFEVLYYGEYIPAHGAQTVAICALLLESHKDIHFTMIGEGKGKPAAMEIIEKAKLKNVTVKGWMSPQELATHVRQADLVMGFLGNGELVERAIPNKVYQGMASGKCVVTGESVAIRESLEHGQNIYVIAGENAKSLAETILLLKNNEKLRENIANQAYTTFTNRFNRHALAEQIVRVAESLYSESLKGSFI